MTIAINCWVLRNKNLDGIGYYTVNSIPLLIKAHPEVQFLLLCDKNFSENYFDYKNVTIHRIFPALRHPVLYVLYLEIMLPLFLKKHKPDMYFSVDGFLSLLSSCPQIPLIHDINFEHNPKDLTWKNRVYYRFFFSRFVKKAKRIATISAYSKSDISNFYKADASKIDIVSAGVSNEFTPLEKDECAAVRNKWSAGKPYFFFVGSMHPRKNIKRLIEAFTLFKKDTGSDYKLVLAGSILWSKSEIEEAYQNSFCKDDIIFTGRLSDNDLKKVTAAAFALSFVPVFEGFGLPILEAMQSGVPVICSNVTSMPEVAGDAALMVDPYNVNDIAKGLERLYRDDAFRIELMRRGHIQKAKFSWQKTADLIWDCIIRAIEG